MILLGILALLMGGCIGAMAALLPTFADNPQIAEALAELETAGASPALLMAVNAGVTILIGLGFVILGVLVRRGTAGPVITAMVLVGLVLLFQLFATVVLGVTGQLPAAGCNVITLIPLAFAMVMLIQAARNLPAVAALEAQYRQPAMPWGWSGPAYPPPPSPPASGYGYGQRPRPPPIETFESRDHI